MKLIGVTAEERGRRNEPIQLVTPLLDFLISIRIIDERLEIHMVLLQEAMKAKKKLQILSKEIRGKNAQNAFSQKFV